MTEKIIEKISRYNIFNYLLPGFLFLIIISNTDTFYEVSYFLEDNLIISFFIAYFLGLAISRIGSLVLEPFLKWIKFTKFTKHNDFLDAVKEDKKIEILSEENNVFRTLLSLFFVLLILYLFDLIFKNFEYYYILGALLGFILFLFSYKKQTNYITNRINKIIKK